MMLETRMSYHILLGKGNKLNPLYSGEENPIAPGINGDIKSTGNFFQVGVMVAKEFLGQSYVLKSNISHGA